MFIPVGERPANELLVERSSIRDRLLAREDPQEAGIIANDKLESFDWTLVRQIDRNEHLLPRRAFNVPQTNRVLGDFWRDHRVRIARHVGLFPRVGRVVAWLRKRQGGLFPVE